VDGWSEVLLYFRERGRKRPSGKRGEDLSVRPRNSVAGPQKIGKKVLSLGEGRHDRSVRRLYEEKKCRIIWTTRRRGRKVGKSIKNVQKSTQGEESLGERKIVKESDGHVLTKRGQVAQGGGSPCTAGRRQRATRKNMKSKERGNLTVVGKKADRKEEGKPFKAGS